jgi:hypothetical protein
MVGVLILGAMIVCFAAGFSVWSVTIAVRLGKFTNRDGVEITRHEDPIIFWFYMLLGVLPLALCLCIGGWVAYQFLHDGHA